MQMLKAGGMELLTDGVRCADEDNPKGYYEFGKVMHTKDDPAWLVEAEGKVVKMVYLLLYDLPPDRQYNVILMARNIDEVVASQNKMLDRLGRARGELSHAKLAATLSNHLAAAFEWMQAQPNMRLLRLSYHDVLKDPHAAAEGMARFLGAALDTQAMADTVDPSLHRQRRTATRPPPADL